MSRFAAMRCVGVAGPILVGAGDDLSRWIAPVARVRRQDALE
jgi:hypothetical protein